MTPISTTKLLEVLNWRYATKKFDPTQKIPATDWAALEEALLLAPSSFGLQPWKFFVVTDAAVKARFVPVSWGQTQPVECSHFVVFAVRKNLDAAHADRFLARTAELRGIPTAALANYREIIVGSLDKARADGRLDAWQSHQLYIALGQFMTAAALLGIDTCPMEGFEPAKYDEILGLTGTDYASVVACPAGYRAADDKYATAKKIRFQAADVIVRV